MPENAEAFLLEFMQAGNLSALARKYNVSVPTLKKTAERMRNVS